MFLGRALEKQGKQHPAIDAYRNATKLKPDDELAWKGLCNVYESLGSEGVDGHSSAALGLAQIYVEKYVIIRRGTGAIVSNVYLEPEMIKSNVRRLLITL